MTATLGNIPVNDVTQPTVKLAALVVDERDLISDLVPQLTPPITDHVTDEDITAAGPAWFCIGGGGDYVKQRVQVRSLAGRGWQVRWITGFAGPQNEFEYTVDTPWTEIPTPPNADRTEGHVATISFERRS